MRGRPVRARDALRGLEPRHAGGDGHGAAVVATRAGGIPDKIADGETGRLVEPGDVPALADAIAALAREPAERRPPGRGGAPARARAVRLAGAGRPHDRAVRGAARRDAGVSARLRTALAWTLALLALELAFGDRLGRPGPGRLRGARGPIGGLLVAWRARPLALWLLLLPALAHFHFGGGRIGGDGVMYYVQLRLADEGRRPRPHERVHALRADRARGPARAHEDGLRRSIFAVGPAVAWMPFFAAGEAVGRLQRAPDARSTSRATARCT
jgi:hypothetical protein